MIGRWTPVCLLPLMLLAAPVARAQQAPVETTAAQPPSETKAPPPPSETKAPTDAPDGGGDAELDDSILEIGEATPMTRREPTLPALSFEMDGHYGLVGSGPTTGTTDVRFSIFDWWELRTGIVPQPVGLISRFRLGSVHDALGAFILDGGLSGMELGFIAEDDENNAAIRFYFDAAVGYQRAIGDHFGVVANLRYRGRLSTIDDDQEHIFGADARVLWDLPGHVSLSGGLAAAYAPTYIREPSVAFVEVGQPGLSHFLVRIDGHRESLTVPVSMTYGLSDTFDVDVFMTPRIYPQFDAILGAGLRLRFVDLFGVTGRKRL